MKSLDELKKEQVFLEEKDYPVQKVVLKDNKVTKKIVKESIEELHPDEDSLGRG